METSILAALAVVVWLACGLLAWGFQVKYSYVEFYLWEEKKDIGWMIETLLIGPLALLSLLGSGWCKHGLRFSIKRRRRPK